MSSAGWFRASRRSRLDICLAAAALAFCCCGCVTPAVPKAPTARDFDVVLAEAKAGNILARRDLGLRYLNGLGVPEDPVWAFVWLDAAFARLRESVARGGIRAQVASWGPMGAFLRQVRRERARALRRLTPEQRQRAQALRVTE